MAAPAPLLLLTRPAPDNARFLDALAKAGVHGMRVIQSPVLEIKAVLTPLDMTHQRSLIFSSANGVAAYHSVSGRPALPCHVVGARTAQAAQTAGHDVLGAHLTAKDLLTALETNPPADPILHIRGTHARGDIAQTLAINGLSATDVVLYDQITRPLSAEAHAAALGESAVVIPLFSPRSATQVAQDWSGSAPALGVALSGAVADAAKPMTWRSLTIAPTPTIDAMVNGVADLLRREPG